MTTETEGALVLADGTVFTGTGIGIGHTGNNQSHMHTCGEVVFNTALTGYQEIISDPSYAEQIVTFTTPHIGNVGCNLSDMESAQPQLKGIITRSLSRAYSNWRAQQSLINFLEQHQVLALTDIDTRALTLHLRHHGSQPGCLMVGNIDIKQALIYANNFPTLQGQDLASTVSTHKKYTYTIPTHVQHCHIVVLDFGVKNNILLQLKKFASHLTIVPATTPAHEILQLKPDGVVLSNGPGDPTACVYAIATIQKLLAWAIPIFGICLGHQLLALASGAKIKKMTYGHHSANHPILSLQTGKVAISSQNHGFVVADDHLPGHLQITHRSLFDNTIAGIARVDVPAFGFQGHPEAGPGPTELYGLFQDFKNLMEVTHAEAIGY